MANDTNSSRYFISYSGVKLPLKLVNELKTTERENRNTYFRGVYDAQDRLSCVEKWVYGAIELLHIYEYHANGVLRQAKITDADGETTILCFDVQGELQEQHK
jgi:hypothetical protein